MKALSCLGVFDQKWCCDSPDYYKSWTGGITMLCQSKERKVNLQILLNPKYPLLDSLWYSAPIPSSSVWGSAPYASSPCPPPAPPPHPYSSLANRTWTGCRCWGVERSVADGLPLISFFTAKLGLYFWLVFASDTHLTHRKIQFKRSQIMSNWLEINWEENIIIFLRGGSIDFIELYWTLLDK